MRFQSTVLAVAATLAFASAQNLPNVPKCAIPCFVAALPASNCNSTDIKCQCTTGRDPLQQSLMACVPTKCTQEEALSIIPAVAGLCASAGVSLSNIPTATASIGATATAVASMSTTASPSGAKSTPAGSPAATATATASGSTPHQSTGAASGNVAAVGAVALGLAAAAFGL